MHQRPGYQPVPRPLLVVAALLATLGLLTMHTLTSPPAAASTTTSSEAAHADHEHTHPDHGDAPPAHHSSEAAAHPSPGGSGSSSGQPCTSCPGCDHDTASVCALTPAKAGTSHLLLSVTDLAPAPHQLTSWPTVGNKLPQAEPVPPSLIDLSISRT